MGRLLVWRAGWLKNQGLRNTRETSLAKWHATEHAVQSAMDAIQVHGANGYSNEFPVERYLRNSKAAVIYEGTSQLHTVIQAEYALGYRQDKPLRCEPLPAQGWERPSRPMTGRRVRRTRPMPGTAPSTASRRRSSPRRARWSSCPGRSTGTADRADRSSRPRRADAGRLREPGPSSSRQPAHRPGRHRAPHLHRRRSAATRRGVSAALRATFGPGAGTRGDLDHGPRPARSRLPHRGRGDRRPTLIADDLVGLVSSGPSRHVVRLVRRRARDPRRARRDVRPGRVRPARRTSPPRRSPGPPTRPRSASSGSSCACSSRALANLAPDRPRRRVPGSVAGRARARACSAGPTRRLPLRRSAFQAFRKLLTFLAYADPGRPGARTRSTRRSATCRIARRSRRSSPPIRPLRLHDAGTADGRRRSTLEADVVIVGSGAGGGVIAAELDGGRPIGRRRRGRAVPRRGAPADRRARRLLAALPEPRPAHDVGRLDHDARRQRRRRRHARQLDDEHRRARRRPRRLGARPRPRRDRRRGVRRRRRRDRGASSGSRRRP